MTPLQRNILILATAFIVSFLALALVVPFEARAALLTQTLDVGDSNADVTSLQTYLATDPSMYPSGLVTGFFGPLTEAAVQRFQSAQGIVTSGTPATTGYGRVGPTTLARINVLMGNSVSSDTAPLLSAASLQTTNTSVTYHWTTNEPTFGEVYSSLSPLQSDEATGPHQKPYVSGTLAVDAGGLQTSHTITVSNLAPNSLYYYLIRSTDSTGNMSMLWPSTVRTNN